MISKTTPISTSQFKPQIVNRKLLFTPQVIKPMNAFSTNSASVNRVAVTGNNTPATVINSGNIKFAPITSKHVTIRPANADGKPAQTQSPKFFILKSNNGQPSTLVPMNGSPAVVTSNGTSSPMRFLISKPINAVPLTAVPITSTKTVAATSEPLSNLVPVTASNNSTSIRSGAINNSIKLVLNPSNSNSNSTPKNSFRISQSSTPTTQHIVINGGNKISTSGKIIHIKAPISNSAIASSNMPQTMVSFSSLDLY